MFVGDDHFEIDIWSGVLLPLYDLAAATPPNIAIAAAVAIGGIYGGLAGGGRIARRSHAQPPELSVLACKSGAMSGAAMAFFHWVLVSPAPPIVGELAQLFDGGLMHWLVRELSIFGLVLALPLTILFGAAVATAFAIGAVSLASTPIGALMLLPDVLALLWLLLVASMRGLAYVFVRHPASAIVLPALRHDHAVIDGKAFSRAITPSRRSLAHPPMRFMSERKRRDAEALQEKLLADARLAQAMIERERARAALRDAKDRVHALRPQFWRWT